MFEHLSVLDCTLRDGGYYNSWNFSTPMINDYLATMAASGVGIVELGLRSLDNESFKGPCAFTRDDFVSSLVVPKDLILGVMVNASELLGDAESLEQKLSQLFPLEKDSSEITLVRIACHTHELVRVLPATSWLKDRGFSVGVNLMQIADCKEAEVEQLAVQAALWQFDVLYFADSLGGMDPEQTARIVGWLRRHWKGALGIHTHDNMGQALANSLRAVNEGVSWLDATVTGMGRGPGNVKTEYLIIELAERAGNALNIKPLMALIRKYFVPLQKQYEWGTNAYYYLAGKYGIHPTYIQVMLNDSRFSEEDVLVAIEHLRLEGGKKYNVNTLDASRYFYQGTPDGSWEPVSLFAGKEVLILGNGPGAVEHRAALESYVARQKPVVIALNTYSALSGELIDVRVACHPVRMLADCAEFARLAQPLITPNHMLPPDVQEALVGTEILDFGLSIQPECFRFDSNHCTVPSPLVLAYALAAATSGQAKNILLAGFDGYGADDPRSEEIQHLFSLYLRSQDHCNICAITPTTYNIKRKSVYAL